MARETLTQEHKDAISEGMRRRWEEIREREAMQAAHAEEIAAMREELRELRAFTRQGLESLTDALGIMVEKQQEIGSSLTDMSTVVTELVDIQNKMLSRIKSVRRG